MFIKVSYIEIFPDTNELTQKGIYETMRRQTVKHKSIIKAFRGNNPPAPHLAIKVPLQWSHQHPSTGTHLGRGEYFISPG